jgi:hypothetical protein
MAARDTYTNMHREEITEYIAKGREGYSEHSIFIHVVIEIAVWIMPSKYLRTSRARMAISNRIKNAISNRENNLESGTVQEEGQGKGVARAALRLVDVRAIQVI